MCPEGWIAYNDSCYQFNMDISQKTTWAEAEAACNAIGNFASLVKINSQSEQDFVNQRIQSISGTDAWIGLNDINKENVFKWTADKSSTSLDNTNYQIWANGIPSENNDGRDCAMILSVRKDGAWSVQNCSQKQNYVCMRHRGKHLIKIVNVHSNFILVCDWSISPAYFSVSGRSVSNNHFWTYLCLKQITI